MAPSEANPQDEEETGLVAEGPEFQPLSRSQKKKKRKQSGKLILLVLLVLIGAGVVAWGTFSDRFVIKNSGDVPLVRADFGPVKVRPEKPGGMNVPDRDKLIYQRMQKDAPPPRVERLLPPAEAPLPSPAETPPPPQAPPQVPPQVAPPQVPPQVQVQVPPLTPTPPPPSPPKAPPKVTKAAAPVSVKGYQVQLLAGRSREAAIGEWKRLHSRHADLLGPLSPIVVKADLGGKGIFYRLRAGTLKDEQAARALCAKLAARKVNCLVIRPQG